MTLKIPVPVQKTPQDLATAIVQAFDYYGLINEKENLSKECPLLIQSLSLHVSDFIAQKFNAEMLRADDLTEKKLYRLFKNIVGLSSSSEKGPS